MILAQVIINGILTGAIYALIGVGLTLIFGVLRVVNFAHGEFLMLGMYAAYWAWAILGLNPYVAPIIVLPLSFAFGYVVQRVIIRPLVHASDSDVSQIFATFGLSMVLRNAALFLWTGDYRVVRTPVSQSYLSLGNFLFSAPTLITFGAALVATVALFAFLRMTFVGKAVRATAQDKRAALLMGVNVDRIYVLAFSLGTACAALAGVLLTPILPAFPTIGGSFGTLAFVVVVLGGLGNMIGALGAGIVIGISEALGGYLLTPALKEAVYFGIFILALLLRSSRLSRA